MAALQFNLAKVSLALCLLLALTSYGARQMTAEASSIPIWEFLTRNEKMSYLYSSFAQLVSVHCKTTAATSNLPVNQCKRDLLNYGYEKLQTFTDTQLEILDPYQRGASELIWTSIMRDHPSSHLITTRKPLPTPPATSIIILTAQKSSTIKPNVADDATITTETQYPQNPMFDMTEQKHQYAMDMDIAYGYPSMPSAQNPQIEVFDVTNSQNTYLTGPSVVRVNPDGSPVEEDRNKPLAKDDDMEHFVSPLSYAPREEDIKTVAANNSNGKHRKIATINALKQQYLANLAMQQQELLPPFEDGGRGRGRGQRQAIAFNYERARV